MNHFSSSPYGGSPLEPGYNPARYYNDVYGYGTTPRTSHEPMIPSHSRSSSQSSRDSFQYTHDRLFEDDASSDSFTASGPITNDGRSVPSTFDNATPYDFDRVEPKAFFRTSSPLKPQRSPVAQKAQAESDENDPELGRAMNRERLRQEAARLRKQQEEEKKRQQEEKHLQAQIAHIPASSYNTTRRRDSFMVGNNGGKPFEVYIETPDVATASPSSPTPASTKRQAPFTSSPPKSSPVITSPKKMFIVEEVNEEDEERRRQARIVEANNLINRRPRVKFPASPPRGRPTTLASAIPRQPSSPRQTTATSSVHDSPRQNVRDHGYGDHTTRGPYEAAAEQDMYERMKQRISRSSSP